MSTFRTVYSARLQDDDCTTSSPEDKQSLLLETSRSYLLFSEPNHYTKELLHMVAVQASLLELFPLIVALNETTNEVFLSSVE